MLAESTLAIRLVQIVHQSLAGINRSLKSGLPLSVSLMESAIEIASMKVRLKDEPIVTFHIDFLP